MLSEGKSVAREKLSKPPGLMLRCSGSGSCWGVGMECDCTCTCYPFNIQGLQVSTLLTTIFLSLQKWCQHHASMDWTKGIRDSQDCSLCDLEEEEG